MTLAQKWIICIWLKLRFSISTNYTGIIGGPLSVPREYFKPNITAYDFLYKRKRRSFLRRSDANKTRTRQTWSKLKSSLYFKTRKANKWNKQINKDALGRLKDLLLLCMPENVHLFRCCANIMTVLTGFQKCLHTRRSPSEGDVDDGCIVQASDYVFVIFQLHKIDPDYKVSRMKWRRRKTFNWGDGAIRYAYCNVSCFFFLKSQP